MVGELVQMVDSELDTGVPFFSYGLFKKDEICYPLISDFVSSTEDAVISNAQLYLRDGIPLISTGMGSIEGDLFRFGGDAHKAYRKINELEPTHNQYTWEKREVTAGSEDIQANVLVGDKPAHGGNDLFDSWSSKEDPLFTTAIKLIKNEINTTEESVETDVTGRIKPEGHEDIFRLNMAYLLLWTSIERYLTLRYEPNLGTNQVDRYDVFDNFANTDKFSRGLEEVVDDEIDGCRIHMSKNPEKTRELSKDDPKKAIRFYWTVRNNVAHRGKSAVHDYTILRQSSLDLVKIFEEYILHR